MLEKNIAPHCMSLGGVQEKHFLLLDKKKMFFLCKKNTFFLHKKTIFFIDYFIAVTLFCRLDSHLSGHV